MPSSVPSSSPPPPPPPPPPSSSLASRLGSVSFTTALLGFLSGLTVYYGIEWLRYWPEPLPSLQSLLDSDPLLHSSVGSPVRVSPLWTGTVRPGESFSVSLPVRGSLGSGRVYARGVYDSTARQWKLIYLQAAVGGLQQRHTLHIPPHMDVRGAASDTAPSAGALVMPANFNPTLLPPEQFVKYQQFLKQHGMREWKSDGTEKVPQVEPSSAASSDSASIGVPESNQPAG